MNKEKLHRRIEAEAMSGFGVPEGMLNEWKIMTGADYQPSVAVKLMCFIMGVDNFKTGIKK